MRNFAIIIIIFLKYYKMGIKNSTFCCCCQEADIITTSRKKYIKLIKDLKRSTTNSENINENAKNLLQMESECKVNFIDDFNNSLIGKIILLT